MKLLKDKIKINNFLFAIVLIALIVLFLIGTFMDLTFAKNIWNPNSFYGSLFDQVGLISFSIPVLFGFVIIFQSLKIHKKKNIKLWWEFPVYIILVIVFIFVLWKNYVLEGKSFSWNNEAKTIVIISIVFTGIYISEIYYLFKKPTWLVEDKKIIQKVIFMLMFVFTITVTTEILKNIFSRPRPITVFDGSNTYREWWNIHYTGRNKSFPSGHTTAAVSTLGMAMLFNSKSKMFYGVILFATIITILVGTSRMVLGAHFLTDITMATISGICFFALFNKFAKQNSKKLNK